MPGILANAVPTLSGSSKAPPWQITRISFRTLRPASASRSVVPFYRLVLDEPCLPAEPEEKDGGPEMKFIRLRAREYERDSDLTAPGSNGFISYGNVRIATGARYSPRFSTFSPNGFDALSSLSDIISSAAIPATPVMISRQNRA